MFMMCLCAVGYFHTQAVKSLVSQFGCRDGGQSESSVQLRDQFVFQSDVKNKRRLLMFSDDPPIKKPKVLKHVSSFGIKLARIQENNKEVK